MGNLTEQDNAWCVGGRYYPNERDAWYARQDEERRPEVLTGDATLDISLDLSHDGGDEKR